MSKRQGKTIIGLTGNIATGKSVVRRMLEHLGAYTIDADTLAHRVIAKNAPGYKRVLDMFGSWLLDEDEQINRSKLGKLVFSDSDALGRLEAIIHPYVGQAVDLLIRRASQPVVAIEAIKLLESNLYNECDSIWVVDAPEQIQIERLVRKRGLSHEEARQRIHAQAPQAEKLAAANVVIKNNGSYDDLWKQIVEGWQALAPIKQTAPLVEAETKPGEFSLQRGRPRDSQKIAALITRLSKGKRAMSADDVMEAFGDKAYLILRMGDEPVGVAGWQVENLVARTSDLYIDAQIAIDKALPLLLQEVEEASNSLQCEVSLVFPPIDLVGFDSVWKNIGYSRRSPESLGSQAWMEAANESMPRGGALFFKQLRADRVLRPI
ncbi:MAG: dephospho-CoA kinase [Anaerolineaceae bacterium]|nr:dephospho-CoA kinase [Anaerolineales bacterium]MEB2334301.1 dephospho-CoA kinase [Anaerolineaceae bacterium]